MVSRGGASISWTSYNLPSQINQSGGNSSQFSYGAFRQRYKQVNVNGSTTTTTIYAGKLLEKVTVGSVTDYKHYVQAVGQTVAIHIRSSTSTNSTYYPLKDHLGSFDRVTNSAGSVLVALSYDAFGKRRGSNWTGSPSSGDLTNIAATTRHGFTEHEHLDNLTLVHMNGRVYDPAIGRFNSADPFIQSLSRSQSFNRFSYAWNGPLRYTDPSGFENSPYPSRPIDSLAENMGQMEVLGRNDLFGRDWIRQMAQDLVRRIQRGGTIVVGDWGRGRDENSADTDSDDSDDDDDEEDDEIKDRHTTCVQGIFRSQHARHYTEPQTAEFLHAARDQGSLGEIASNHTGAGRFDFITNNHVDDTWSINGSTYNANEFGNYLAGYSGAYHGGYTGYSAARTAGVLWNVAQHGTESDFDQSSAPYIQDGAAQGELDRQRGGSIAGECDAQGQQSNSGGG